MVHHKLVKSAIFGADCLIKATNKLVQLILRHIVRPRKLMNSQKRKGLHLYARLKLIVKHLLSLQPPSFACPRTRTSSG